MRDLADALTVRYDPIVGDDAFRRLSDILTVRLVGRRDWCEKTPFNILCMDFLWELVPEATIVHIKRHPVAVVASHVDQPWAPPRSRARSHGSNPRNPRVRRTNT